MSQDVIVNNGVLSYPHLWTPSVAKGSDTPRWGCSVIVPQNFDWSQIQLAIQEAIAAEWPQGAPQNLRMPWEIVQDGPYAGCYAIKFYRKAEGGIPPEVVMQNPQVKAGPHQAGEFFAGSIVNVWGRAFGYQVGAPGVSLYLNAVQLVNNDPSLPRLDNQKPASEVFQTVAGAPAPTAGVAGQPAGMPAGQPMQQPAQGNPAGQPMQQPAQGTQSAPAGQPWGQQAGPAGMPAQGQQAPAQGNPAGQPMPQGVPGAGVPVGAPAGNPAGQPAQQQGMPWNTPQ